MVRLLYRTAALVALFLGAQPVVAVAQGFKVPPTPDHHVTDLAGALSFSTRTALENQLQSYEGATGHQIVVWVGETTGDVPLETWTGDTADHWKVGRRGHDDGAVLFVFMRDHKVRIEVGYGLESALTDADAHRIISEDIVPRMRSANVDGAISSGVSAMLTTISPAYAGASPPPDSATPEQSTSLSFVIIVLGLSIVFVIFVVMLEVTRELRYGYLVLREGRSAARKDMRSWPAWGAALYSGAGAFSGGFGGGFGGGFSAGGGGFGGGGASGGW